MSAISSSVIFLYPSFCSRWVWKWYKLLPDHHHTDVHITSSIHCCLHIQSIAEKSQERDNKSLLTDDGRKSWCGCGEPPPANISQQPYLKISLLSGVELRLPTFFISQEHKKSSMLWEDSHLSAYPACLYINLSDNYYGSNSVWCRYWPAQC